MFNRTGSTGTENGPASLDFLTCRKRARRNFSWLCGILFVVSYVGGEGSVLSRFAGGSSVVGGSWKGLVVVNLEGASFMATSASAPIGGFDVGRAGAKGSGGEVVGGWAIVGVGGAGFKVGGGVGSLVGSGESTAGPENKSCAVYPPSPLWPLTISAKGVFSSTSIDIGGSDSGLSNCDVESADGMSTLCDSCWVGGDCVGDDGGWSRTSEVKASTTAGCERSGDAARGSPDCRGDGSRSYASGGLEGGVGRG